MFILTQKLVIDGFESEAVKLTQGVPQGSVLALYYSPYTPHPWVISVNSTTLTFIAMQITRRFT